MDRPDVRQQSRPVGEYLAAPGHEALVRTGSTANSATPRPLVRVTAEVRLQHALGAERRRAAGEGALVRHLALRLTTPPLTHRVQEFVLLQLRRGAEGLVAVLHVADIGTVVGVNARVAVQRARRGERLLADGTQERLSCETRIAPTLM